jgi:hypothetical protein
MKPDEPDLVGLAGSVAEGAQVDWTRAGESRGLAGLKLIEQLSAAYREEIPSPQELAAASTAVFAPRGPARSVPDR